LVYGGGDVGLMGKVARTVFGQGGEVIGVIPKAIATKEVAYNELSNLRVVDSMHERKALMAHLSDAFIALPGGLGTVEEFLEILTWAQLGIHKNPCGLLNIGGYFDDLIKFLLNRRGHFPLKNLLNWEIGPLNCVRRTGSNSACKLRFWFSSKTPVRLVSASSDGPTLFAE
jgi:predicted Rossmann-fold nucleotide-binding protein